MTESCGKVLEQLGAELGPELAEHARTCEHCQRVLGAYRTMPDAPPAQLSPRAVDAIRAQAVAELSNHPRARPWWWQALLLSAVNLGFALVGALAMGKHGLVLNAAPVFAVAGLAVLLGSVILLAPFASSDPGHRWTRTAFLVSVPLLAAAITFGGSGSSSAPGFVRGGLPCAVTEVVLWIIPGFVALWALRGSAFQPRRAAAAAIGSSAVGLFVLELHCSIGDPEHLFVFHVAPSLLLIALLIGIRSRIPSRSFAP